MSHILVVEDSRLSRCIIADALRDAGHNISVAVNGEEGLTSFCQDRHDCVITDLLMPVMDGKEMIRRIRAIDSDVPIIVVSADIQRSSRSECEELGVDAFFNKPVETEAFLTCVHAALAQEAGVELNETQ